MKNSGDWKNFFIAAGIRAVRTVAQSAVAAIGTSAMLGQVDWRVVIGTAGLSGITSILTSIATGLPEVDVHHD